MIGVTPGPALAGANFFDITITAKGCHAASPETGIDSLVIAASLVGQIQTIVSRNIKPTDPVVVSVTQFHAGAAYNVIPEVATLAGTVRYFNRDAAARVTERMQALCDGTAAAHGIEVKLDMRNVFDVLENDPTLSQHVYAVARDLVGDKAELRTERVMGSEDFADMAQIVPGVQCTIGHGIGPALHNPGFNFDDAFLTLGSAYYIRMVETRGAA